MTPSPRKRTISRGRRMALAGVVVVSLVATGVMTATTASAAVPAFPDNLVVFPNRDFVTVEGYQDRIGQTATVQVTRPGVGVVGSAQAVVAAGDVAFEINHPGGVCWGAGTGLNVTPDILPGDVTSISFAGVNGGDTIAQDGYVTAPSAVSTTTLAGDTVTITGHIGADVIQANTEQRVIEPALNDTVIGRRDVRALPGPMTVQDNGYSSGMVFDDDADTFTATYVFDDPAVATIVADAGGARLMAWQVVDLADNRQGLTIHEFGELGGPGMGGCPNGPLQTGPAGPTSVSAATVADGIKLTWTPAVAVPGTPAITGYRATAIAQSVVNGEQVEIGRRITGQAASGTTITGLSSTETYDVEVVSVSSVGLTFPPITAIPVTDTIAPIVTASPVGGTFAVPQDVTLSANETGAQIYYTTDGTDPVEIDVLAASAVSYTAPIVISASTTLKFVAFDPTGNVSLIGTQIYTITNTPSPDAPVLEANPVIGEGQITLSWTATDATITGYGVQVYDADGTTVGALRETTGTTLAITGLTEGTQYYFTVKAQNANGYGLESAKLGPLSPNGAVVANAGPDQTGVVRNTTVSLNGSTSSAEGVYAWTQLATGTVEPIAATSPDRVTLDSATTRTASFALPFYKFPMTNKALTFSLSVTKDGVTRTDVVLITPRSDIVTIGSATWKSSDFRVRGTATTVGSVITVRSAPSAAGAVTIYGTATVTAAVAPAVGGVWEMRLRNNQGPRTNPGTVIADSNVGGSSGPFTIENR